MGPGDQSTFQVMISREEKNLVIFWKEIVLNHLFFQLKWRKLKITHGMITDINEVNWWNLNNPTLSEDWHMDQDIK